MNKGANDEVGSPEVKGMRTAGSRGHTLESRLRAPPAPATGTVV